MKAVFVDSSAILALGDSNERHHALATRIWTQLREQKAKLETSNYVVLELVSILQRRFGIAAVHSLEDELLQAVEVNWIDEAIHSAAMKELRKSGRRKLSLVDLTSFELMRARGLEEAFSFDQHFTEQGFRLPRFS